MSTAVLSSGWFILQNRRQQRLALVREDEARRILGIMAAGSKLEPYLTRVGSKVKPRLRKLLDDQSVASLNPHLQLLHSSFPVHELWAFSIMQNGSGQQVKPVLYPAMASGGRRGMARILNALTCHDQSAADEKLVDFIFGPGLTIENLFLRRGMPSRIIYRNQHHLMLWDIIEENGRPTGGFFLLVPDSSELNRYAMVRSAKLANSGHFHQQDADIRSCIAGYLRIFSSETGSILPARMLQLPELKEFLRQNSGGRRLPDLENRRLPWGEKYGDWELFTRTIPYSSHLAFVFLPAHNGYAVSDLTGRLKFHGLIVVLLILTGFSGLVAIPAIKLKTRFSLLFLSLASIPFSLIFAAGGLYLEEFEVSLVRETRQQLHKALSEFDQGVENTYLRYRSEFQELRNHPMLQATVSGKQEISEKLLDQIRSLLEGFSPPLPWGSIMLINPEGKSIDRFRSAYHKAALAGYSTFNRVGMLDAMRKGNSLPDIGTATSSSFINDRDVAVKRAFETLVRLPVCHGFVNKLVGQPTQVAFGSFSIVRIFDYFPSAADPKLVVSATWLEDELDWHFCSETLKKLRREYPGSRFAFYREQPDGLKVIAQSHTAHNLSMQAFSASLGNAFSFRHRREDQKLEVAFSSRRRPGIILAGEMETGFIAKRVKTMTRDFFLVFLVGLATIVFFRRFLTERLIRPFLLLQRSLSLLKSGRFERMPELKRSDEIAGIFLSFNEMLDGLQARQRLLSLVSGNALHIAREASLPAADSAARASSVIILVSDIRDFTTLCEKHPPDVITRLLNLHFDRMSQIIYSHGGEISRFVGDAIEASFPFPEEEAEISCRRAVEAGLVMLHTMKMINEERLRQGFFTYRIGIGLASGVSHFVQVGGRDRRTEILQLNKALKKANELEGLSRDFAACPMVIEKKLGEILETAGHFQGFLETRCFEHRTVYVFSATPDQNSFLKIENSQEYGSYENKIENFDDRPDLTGKVCAYRREAEQTRSFKVSFLSGVVLLMIPFLLILWGIFHGLSQNSDETAGFKREKLHQNLEISRNPLNKKQLVESHIRQTLQEMMNLRGFPTLADGSSASAAWQTTLEMELRKVGLIPEEIIFAAVPPEKNIAATGISNAAFAMLSRREKLSETLKDCLRCYNQQFDRFLLPPADRLSYLGDYMSGLLLVRDTRARFETVNIASASYWLYWQPLHEKSYTSGAKHANALRFGRKAAGEHFSDIAGGIILVCHSPESDEVLCPPLPDKDAVVFHIGLKDNRLIEVAGNSGLLSELLPACASDTATAGQLIAFSHQAPGSDKVLVESVISQGDNPVLHVAVSPFRPISGFGLMAAAFAVLLMALSLLAVLLLWYLTSQERGLASTVRRQIMGSFTGMLLLPLAGLVTVLVMLAGDWQKNLVNESIERFRQQVDQTEQQIRFHHTFSPMRVRKMLERIGLKEALQNSDSLQLQNLLTRAYRAILRDSQGLGVNSVMIDASDGRSEFLAVDGSLSSPEDPMKRAFSFHARRVISRLNRGSEDVAVSSASSGKADAGLVDEITTQLIFEILDSTFGPEASLKILFGQQREVELFSSVSNDVLFQEIFPDMSKPMGTVFTIFSHLHSNIFAVARILAAQHSENGERAAGFSVFSASRLNPGMPILPETGEKLPFIREAAAISLLTGPYEDVYRYDGEDYYVVAQPSITFPQFVFTGIALQKQFFGQVRNRLLHFLAAILLFLLFMMWLSLHTARDITVPLEQLLAGISRLKAGDFSCRLAFDRADELENIADEFNGMVKQLAEKDILVRMVSESAAEMASSAEAESDARRGVRKRAAVVYMGVNGFEHLAARSNPLEMQKCLSSWVGQATSVIAGHGGEIDKILEGKILAVFFAASDDEQDCEKYNEHVARAFNAAISFCCQCESEKIATSCGVHAGEVISGLMGNQDRRDFTIIGDTVNMSARCFSIAEKLEGNGCVVASEATAKLAGKTLRWSQLGTMPVKGKQLPVRLVKAYR